MKAITEQGVEKLNKTTLKVLLYLSEHLPNNGSFIPYNAIAESLGIKRHSIQHAVSSLIAAGLVILENGKLRIVEGVIIDVKNAT